MESHIRLQLFTYLSSVTYAAYLYFILISPLFTGNQLNLISFVLQFRLVYDLGFFLYIICFKWNLVMAVQVKIYLSNFGSNLCEYMINLFDFTLMVLHLYTLKFACVNYSIKNTSWSEFLEKLKEITKWSCCLQIYMSTTAAKCLPICSAPIRSIPFIFSAILMKPFQLRWCFPMLCLIFSSN